MWRFVKVDAVNKRLEVSLALFAKLMKHRAILPILTWICRVYKTCLLLISVDLPATVVQKLQVRQNQTSHSRVDVNIVHTVHPDYQDLFGYRSIAFESQGFAWIIKR